MANDSNSLRQAANLGALGIAEFEMASLQAGLQPSGPDRRSSMAGNGLDRRSTMEAASVAAAAPHFAGGPLAVPIGDAWAAAAPTPTWTAQWMGGVTHTLAQAEFAHDLTLPDFTGGSGWVAPQVAPQQDHGCTGGGPCACGGACQGQGAASRASSGCGCGSAAVAAATSSGAGCGKASRIQGQQGGQQGCGCGQGAATGTPHGVSAGNPWPLDDPRHNLVLLAQELLLLEGHLADPERRCPSCVTKHALTVRALADEGRRLDPNVDSAPVWQQASSLALSGELGAIRSVRQSVVGTLLQETQRGGEEAVAAQNLPGQVAGSHMRALWNTPGNSAPGRTRGATEVTSSCWPPCGRDGTLASQRAPDCATSPTPADQHLPALVAAWPQSATGNYDLSTRDHSASQRIAKDAPQLRNPCAKMCPAGTKLGAPPTCPCIKCTAMPSPEEPFKAVQGACTDFCPCTIGQCVSLPPMTIPYACAGGTCAHYYTGRAICLPKRSIPCDASIWRQTECNCLSETIELPGNFGVPAHAPKPMCPAATKKTVAEKFGYDCCDPCPNGIPLEDGTCTTKFNFDGCGFAKEWDSVARGYADAAKDAATAAGAGWLDAGNFAGFLPCPSGKCPKKPCLCPNWVDPVSASLAEIHGFGKALIDTPIAEGPFKGKCPANCVALCKFLSK